MRRHQGADGRIRAADGTEVAPAVQAGGPGTVHVRSYAQTRDGDMVRVSAHERGAPGAGADAEPGKARLPKMVPPVTNPKIRNKDGFGSGHFGARRDGGARDHMGVDIVTQPGEPVVSPVSGRVTVFDPYPSGPLHGKMQGVQIVTDDGDQVRVMYVRPDAQLKKGGRVEQGQPIGTADDMAKHYGLSRGNKPMTNHVHIDVKKNGGFIDPTPIFNGK